MKAVFWNCSGTGNLGDDLCHLGAVQWLKRQEGFTAGFEWSQIFRMNRYTIGRVNEADILVIGGGRLLAKSDVIEMLLGQDVRVPYVFVGVGIGSVGDIEPFGGRLKPVRWHVRNERSADILASCGHLNVEVGEDVSALVDIQFNGRVGESVGGLNLKAEGKTEAFAHDLGARLEALPFAFRMVSFNSTPRKREFIDGEACWISDSDDTHFLLGLREEAKRHERPMTYQRLDDPAEWCRELGELSFMVCERYHAAVLAHRLGIPFVVIGTYEKTRIFMEERGLHDRIVPCEPEAIERAMTMLHEEALSCQAA